MNLTPWAFVILPLGVCRATQIMLFDRVTATPRNWLLRQLNPHGYPVDDPRRPYLSVLWECPWCASVWLGAVATGFVAWDGSRAATLLVLAALALSLVAVAIDRMFDRWLPDMPHSSATMYGEGFSVEGPPTEVQAAFDAVEAER